jgi:rsbT co-antagonist protein RsbR
MSVPGQKLRSVLQRQEREILQDWLQCQLAATTLRGDLIRENELREQSREFLSLLQTAAQSGSLERTDGTEWAPVRDFLGPVSRSRAQQGVTPSETALFVFSLKQPLYSRLRTELASDSAALADELWVTTQLIDRLGLFTTEMYQKGREEVISRQQQELMELSTPVVQLWDSVLALPLVGTLDSERTQVVMETLLQRIVETGAMIAIIDITGVATVDTLVAQHLMKTIAAARLMGADCIISGIRPQIAQTIVHLGINLSDVTTKASLADAFLVALRRTGARMPQAAGG